VRRPVRVIAVQPPCGSAKNQRKEKKEPAGHLQEHDAAHTAEGSQESTHSARHSAAHAHRRGAGLACARACVPLRLRNSR